MTQNNNSNQCTDTQLKFRQILPLSLHMENRATSQAATSRGTTHFDDSIATTAMRAHVNGESRNCKIDPKSTSTCIRFAPILTLQYISLLIATMLLVCLASILLSGSLPQLPYSHVIATLDPTLKAFIYFFGCGALIYVASLLSKPVRALEFDKNKGVFWIEKQLIFGWKVGESAQMPVAQICSLQILSYAHPEGINYKSQVSTKEHEINVVFCNDERVNIVSHCNGKAIRQDANALAAFLQVPVCDIACSKDESSLPVTTEPVDNLAHSQPAP